MNRKQSPDLTNLTVLHLNDDVATRYSEQTSNMTHDGVHRELSGQSPGLLPEPTPSDALS